MELYLYIGLIALALAYLVQAMPQILQETKIADTITNPSGSRQEEINDDRIISRSGGGIELIKTDQISSTFGSRYPYNRNQQGSYNPNYFPSGRR